MVEYKEGDIIRTRGSLAGLIGRVIFYEPPDDDLEDHGVVMFTVLTTEPGSYWERDPPTEIGEEEGMCIYHPESEWYHKCGGGNEPEVLVPEMMDPSDWNSPEEMAAVVSYVTALKGEEE
jgi:hypothetical protein